jgi:hypothetical protein
MRSSALLAPSMSRVFSPVGISERGLSSFWSSRYSYVWSARSASQSLLRTASLSRAYCDSIASLAGSSLSDMSAIYMSVVMPVENWVLPPTSTS